MSKRFILWRVEDKSGVSGTGKVAEGVQFHNGQAALCWTTDRSSIGIYQSVEDLLHIHGHAGATKLFWTDDTDDDDTEDQVFSLAALYFSLAISFGLNGVRVEASLDPWLLYHRDALLTMPWDETNGMTLPGFIWISDYADLPHEFGHVRQYQAVGPATFGVGYLLSLGRGFEDYLSPDAWRAPASLPPRCPLLRLGAEGLAFWQCRQQCPLQGVRWGMAILSDNRNSWRRKLAKLCQANNLSFSFYDSGAVLKAKLVAAGVTPPAVDETKLQRNAGLGGE